MIRHQRRLFLRMHSNRYRRLFMEMGINRLFLEMYSNRYRRLLLKMCMSRKRRLRMKMGMNILSSLFLQMGMNRYILFLLFLHVLLSFIIYQFLLLLCNLISL
jgi:hypothetical protein